MAGRSAVVALTDRRWFDFLRSCATNGGLDEVNFWRPKAQTDFRYLQSGEPFYFRLKSPVNAVVGYGFFAHATRIPVRLAWEAFKERNGAPTFEGFVARIAEYRKQSPETVSADRAGLVCLIIRAVRFFSESAWRTWQGDRGWSRNIVAYKGYDLDEGPGIELRSMLEGLEPEDLEPVYRPTLYDSRVFEDRWVAVREGQGAFRVRILDAYGRRCAVTGERSLPVLDAAHIQPYRGPASNHVQNGLALRTDLHRLFDAGYVTVTPKRRFIVSRRLRDDYENGRVYYDLHGKELTVVPKDPGNLPSATALEWHANNVFR